jgi:hypothetical protein
VGRNLWYCEARPWASTSTPSLRRTSRAAVASCGRPIPPPRSVSGTKPFVVSTCQKKGTSPPPFSSHALSPSRPVCFPRPRPRRHTTSSVPHERPRCNASLDRIRAWPLRGSVTLRDHRAQGAPPARTRASAHPSDHFTAAGSSTGGDAIVSRRFPLSLSGRLMLDRCCPSGRFGSRPVAD